MICEWNLDKALLGEARLGRLRNLKKKRNDKRKQKKTESNIFMSIFMRVIYIKSMSVFVSNI